MHVLLRRGSDDDLVRSYASQQESRHERLTYLNIRGRYVSDNIEMIVDNSHRRYTFTVHQLQRFGEHFVTATNVSLRNPMPSRTYLIEMTL